MAIETTIPLWRTLAEAEPEHVALLEANPGVEGAGSGYELG